VYVRVLMKRGIRPYRCRRCRSGRGSGP
jgi:hypothetical protein